MQRGAALGLQQQLKAVAAGAALHRCRHRTEQGHGRLPALLGEHPGLLQERLRRGGNGGLGPQQHQMGIGGKLCQLSFGQGFGGKGANQAVAVARLGGDPLFIGKVGGDTFGECLKQDLAATGVDTRLLKIAENTSTGLALIMLAAGENTIVVSPGANGEVSLADVDSVLAYLRRARILMVQLEIPLDTVAYAMRLARQHGLQVILDPGPAQTCPEEILRLADYLTPNETEAAMLTGEQVCDLTSARRAARHLMRFTHQGVVVKLGSAGSGTLTSRSQPSFSSFRCWIATALALASRSGIAWNSETQQRYSL